MNENENNELKHFTLSTKDDTIIWNKTVEVITHEAEAIRVTTFSENGDYAMAMGKFFIMAKSEDDLLLAAYCIIANNKRDTTGLIVDVTTLDEKQYSLGPKGMELVVNNVQLKSKSDADLGYQLAFKSPYNDTDIIVCFQHEWEPLRALKFYLNLTLFGGYVAAFK